VVGPHVMLILDRLDSNTLGELGLAFLPFALLLLISISGGFWMFGHGPMRKKISPSARNTAEN